MEHIFAFNQVSYRYKAGRAPALDHISFRIPTHSKTAIVGPNGAGKSTLIYHMNGLFTNETGEIRFKDEPLTAKSRSTMVRHVGVVFQDPDDQIISMTVRDDVAFGPTQLGLTAEEAYLKAEDSMSLLGITHLANFNPNELSFGQKKLVAIAGVMAMNPEVVIIDEPMAFLDPAGQKRVQEIMDMLIANGKTVIIATHHMQLVAEWADTVIVVKDGCCLGNMPPRRLFCEHPDLLIEAQLDLPPVTRLLTGLWNEPGAEMPIRLEEARNWLASLIGRDRYTEGG